MIGINTAIYSPSGGSIGIGFALPANVARPVLEQIRDFGHPRRGWLGVNIQSVTDEIAESLGLDKPKGALIASVKDGGPAQVAGIQPGDVVLGLRRQGRDRHAPPAAPRGRDADRQDGQGDGLAQARGSRRSTSRSAN